MSQSTSLSSLSSPRAARGAQGSARATAHAGEAALRRSDAWAQVLMEIIGAPGLQRLEAAVRKPRTHLLLSIAVWLLQSDLTSFVAVSRSIASSLCFGPAVAADNRIHHALSVHYGKLHTHRLVEAKVALSRLLRSLCLPQGPHG